jgi:tRNA G46 methylase TrmB
VADNLYDRLHYETFPRRQTHPDRLASVARLFGMDAAPIASCRVLEIGCGDGGNLIPMAYYLPGGCFTGIDLASRAWWNRRSISWNATLDTKLSSWKAAG